MPEVIKRRRLELGMSQAELADQAGVDQRQIRRYESGEAQPTLTAARSLARALAISLDVLAGDPEFAQISGSWWMAWSARPSNTVSVQQVEIRTRGMDLEMAVTESSADGLPSNWRGPLFATRAGGFTGMFTSETVNGSLVLDWSGTSLTGVWVALPSDHGFGYGVVALSRSRDGCRQAIDELMDAG